MGLEAHPAKRAKTTRPDSQAVLLPTRLDKHTVLLPPPVSPGAVFGNRLAAEVTGEGRQVTCYLASGTHVYHTTSHAATPERDVGVEMGKEGVVLPTRGADLVAVPLDTTHARHEHEVQSLSLTSAKDGNGVWLGSVDSVGRAVVRHFTAGHDRHAQGNGKEESNQQGVLLLEPDGVVHEAGWAGVCMDSVPGTGGEVVAATAMHFMRHLCFFQGSKCVRKVSTLQSPTAVTMLPHGSVGGATAGLLACAEEHQVSLWDVRQGEKAGLVQRLPVSVGGQPLFSLAWCSAQGGMLGTAGKERAVTLLDPRKWRVASKWPGATKYAIHYLAFSNTTSSYCYVAGLDYECVVGRWTGCGGGVAGNANSTSGGHGRAVGPAGWNPQQSMVDGQGMDADTAAVTGEEKRTGDNVSFRGDARWMGMALAAGSDGRDTLVTSTQQGTLFVLEAAGQKK